MKSQIVLLVILIAFGSWFVCAWEAPQYGVQLYPRYHDGRVEYDTLKPGLSGDEKWWVDVQFKTLTTPDFSALCRTEIVAEIDMSNIEEKEDPFWQELRDSVFKWMGEKAEPEAPAQFTIFHPDSAWFARYRICGYWKFWCDSLLMTNPATCAHWDSSFVECPKE